MIPNPLRDPRDRRLPRVPQPCALVVFGITGDLARKKLLPAVYDLANRGLLPTNFALLGFARRDWGDTEFAELSREAAREHARTPWREEVWEQLAADITFSRARSTTTTPSTSSPPRWVSWRAATGSAATPPSTCPSRRRCSRPCSSRCSAPAWPRARPIGGGGSSSRSRSARTCPPAASSTHSSTRCSARTTSSGSTTTSARRPSRTCWRCGSPTRSSSRSGTATTSTRCRSRWPRTSASAGGRSSTRRPAPPATCCRTTCSSCWP